MGGQLTDNAAALRMFFTDDIYLAGAEEELSSAEPVHAAVIAEAVVVQEPVAATVIAETAIVQEPVAEIPVVPAMLVAAAVKADFKYLGKNQKNVLIIVNDSENEVSSDRGKELLRNIVKAIQLTANDFALLNYSSYRGTGFPELTTFFSSKLVLIFGVTGPELGIAPHPLHTIIKEAAAQVVFAGNLDLLAADQNGKKTLWGSLKQLVI